MHETMPFVWEFKRISYVRLLNRPQMTSSRIFTVRQRLEIYKVIRAHLRLTTIYAKRGPRIVTYNLSAQHKFKLFNSKEEIAYNEAGTDVAGVVSKKNKCSRLTNSKPQSHSAATITLISTKWNQTVFQPFDDPNIQPTEKNLIYFNRYNFLA